MYFDRWAKTKPAKSGKYPPPHDHKTAAAQISLDHGRFVRNTPKTEQNKSRTNADFLPDCFSFPQRHDSRNRSPYKTQAADSFLFFAAFNRKRAAILKPSLTVLIIVQPITFQTRKQPSFYRRLFFKCSISICGGLTFGLYSCFVMQSIIC